MQMEIHKKTEAINKSVKLQINFILIFNIIFYKNWSRKRKELAYKLS
jgi:hypothetical protein